MKLKSLLSSLKISPDKFSLVPKDDNSLLLINSGMAPMKKYFTGEVTPPRKRVTTCQKCIRTPDIERVGITARHGTFLKCSVTSHSEIISSTRQQHGLGILHKGS